MDLFRLQDLSQSICLCFEGYFPKRTIKTIIDVERINASPNISSDCVILCGRDNMLEIFFKKIV